jgi:hypothetical protein
MHRSKCFSCGGFFPEIEGPVHRYMRSSPGCWSVYGEILAREYSNPDYFEIHRLTVDAYAVQHPGSTDRQSIQSVGFHLIRLCLFLEHNLTAHHANDAMLEAVGNKSSFSFLEPPLNFGPITAAEVAKADSVKEHKDIVREWAHSVWEAWSKHHPIVRTWLPKTVFDRLRH